MAEIKIEKKKPIWPWILFALIILAVVAYFVYTQSDGTDDYDDGLRIESENTEGEELGRTDEGLPNGASYTRAQIEVAEYNSFIGDEKLMGEDADYTRNALMQLTNAVRATAREHGLAVEGELKNLENSGQTIDTDSTETGLVGNVKAIGNDVIAVLQTLQVKKFPELASETGELWNTLAQINPSTELSVQKDTIKLFFKKSGEVLKKMQLKNNG